MAKERLACSVLIVEDEPIIALELDEVLEAAGYHVVGIAIDMHRALAIPPLAKPNSARLGRTEHLLRHRSEVTSRA